MNSSQADLTFWRSGEDSLYISFGTTISEEVFKNVEQLNSFLGSYPIEGVIEWVTSYTTLTIYFDSTVVSIEELQEKISQSFLTMGPFDIAIEDHVVEIPVCYSTTYSPDMERVIEHTGLSKHEIIQRHTSPLYTVYTVGFLPGFPYLGGLDDALITPRLATPRRVVPAGSVGIGGSQTGVYPVENPGGWNLIGMTPVKLYDPERENPFLCKPGDRVRFYEITEAQYQSWEEEEYVY